MWICLVVVVTLGRAHPFTTIQPDIETEGTPDIGLPVSLTPDVTNTTVELTDTDLSENISDDFSFMVAILHKKNYLLGAGAIVGAKWVLVTAFQMGAFTANQLNVRVGSKSAVAGGQLLAVDWVFIHPMFKLFNNDIALLKTNETIILSDSVRLIPVAAIAPDMGDSAMLWVWDNDYSVQKTQADILPMSDCKAFYPDFDLTESSICAVLDHILPFQVSLYGSPLVYNGSLVGLYMGMEANVFKPSVCSNLSPLVGWVHAMMKNETATQFLFPLSD